MRMVVKAAMLNKQTIMNSKEQLEQGVRDIAHQEQLQNLQRHKFLKFHMSIAQALKSLDMPDCDDL
ncbi:hypothetical protein Q5752_002889 [Cryptotrichosporon argae]